MTRELIYNLRFQLLGALYKSGRHNRVSYPKAETLLTLHPSMSGKRKNMAFAVFGGLAPVGGIAGQALAGVFELAWWPWAFWSLAIALVFIAVRILMGKILPHG